MIRRFATAACFDWSGAIAERMQGIALAVATEEGVELASPPARQWSRMNALDWLIQKQAAGSDLLVGFDFSFSLPFADCAAFFPGWRESPADARALWSLIDALCADTPHLAGSGLLAHAEAGDYFRHCGRTGERFGTGLGRLRVTETRCRAGGHGAAQSGFNLVGPAQVGKASLAGMRLLNRLRGRIPIWPFDPVPAAGPMLVEIYTGIAARGAGLRGRTKLRDRHSLDAALQTLGSPPVGPDVVLNEHRCDAAIGAAWLRGAAPDPALWSPPDLTPALARTEGWTFGVP